MHVLDYVGRTPGAADPTAFSSLEALDVDIRSTCVPGTLGGWLAALDRFGTLDRADVFQPAIELAEAGWPITSFAARGRDTAACRWQSSRIGLCRTDAQ